MEDVRIILSASWAAIMLTYLLGDVLRIYSGDFQPRKLGGVKNNRESMVGSCSINGDSDYLAFLSLTLNYPVIRWANIIVADSLSRFRSHRIALIPFRLDKFLIIVGLGFNLLTVWYAWQWTG
jgi:hypothetical protein